MRSARLLSLFAIVTTAACAGEAPIAADEELNWYIDVQPILRGNCFHCHGAIPQGNEGEQHLARKTFRWDICDLDAEAFADIKDLVLAGGPILSANTRARGFKDGYLEAPMGGRETMPPPPAETLSARDKAVVLRWAALGEKASCGSRVGNLSPRAALAFRPVRSNNTMTVTLDVTDGDFDQVLGKLTCGTAEGAIRSSGRVSVALDVTDIAPGSAMLTALVSDGLARTQRNLGACP